MSVIVGVVVSILCSTGNTERLYTWQDENGVIHITETLKKQNEKSTDVFYNPDSIMDNANHF